MVNSPTPEDRQHRLGEVIASLGLLTTLITMITQFISHSQQLVNAIGSLGFVAGATVGVILIGLGLWVRYSKVSRLLKLDALRLDTNNSNHLIGRVNEIDDLEKLCRDSNLIHLVGESAISSTSSANQELGKVRSFVQA